MADYELILTKGLKKMTWVPQERATTPFTIGGGINVELGRPYWLIDCEYANLQIADWKALRSWVTRRRGGKSPFRAFHAMNRTPAGGATSCTVSAGGGGPLTINMTPAAQPGDFVAYDVAGGGRAIHEVLELISGSSFEVFPPADKAGSANPSCVEAAGDFMFDLSSLRMSETYDPKKTVSFKARQINP